ncbi:MAG: hypothetical protein LBR80_18450 [Deltaproteobacteria bacterium]|jgi:hypothetical protein|nr:hypothetical protein [Deltaproteobacteria bacterium]
MWSLATGCTSIGYYAFSPGEAKTNDYGALDNPLFLDCFRQVFDYIRFRT